MRTVRNLKGIASIVAAFVTIHKLGKAVRPPNINQKRVYLFGYALSFTLLATAVIIFLYKALTDLENIHEPMPDSYLPLIVLVPLALIIYGATLVSFAETAMRLHADAGTNKNVSKEAFRKHGAKLIAMGMAILVFFVYMLTRA